MYTCALNVATRRAKELVDGITPAAMMPVEPVIQRSEQLSQGTSRTVDMLFESGYLNSRRVDVQWLHALTRSRHSLDLGMWLLAAVNCFEGRQQAPQLAKVHALLSVDKQIYVHLYFFGEALHKSDHGLLWSFEHALRAPSIEVCCLLQQLTLTTLRAHQVKAAASESNWIAFRESRCVFNMRAQAPLTYVAGQRES